MVWHPTERYRLSNYEPSLGKLLSSLAYVLSIYIDHPARTDHWQV